MERKVLDEGARRAIQHIVGGFDHLDSEAVAADIRAALAGAKAQGRVPQWLEDKAVVGDGTLQAGVGALARDLNRLMR